MSIGRSKTCQRQPYPWSGSNCRKKTLAATYSTTIKKPQTRYDRIFNNAMGRVLTCLQDARVIARFLKKFPLPLPSCLWGPLKRFGFVRTPEEHRHHLLHNAPIVEPTDTPYTQGVRRALSGALALDPITADIKLGFKSGVRADLGLLIEGPNIFINDK
jgi:hypothetical protein